MMKQCARCGKRLTHVVGPAEDDDGTLYVLDVDRCDHCGTNTVNEKIHVRDTINELVAEGRPNDCKENPGEENPGEANRSPEKHGRDDPEDALC